MSKPQKEHNSNRQTTPTYLRVRLPPLGNLFGEQLLGTQSDQPKGADISPHHPVEQALPQNTTSNTLIPITH